MCINTWWGIKKKVDSGAQKQNKRQQAQIQIWEEPFKHKKKLFYDEGDQILTQVAQRGCVVSSLGDTQNLDGHIHEQFSLADHAVSRVLGKVFSRGAFQEFRDQC